MDQTIDSNKKLKKYYRDKLKQESNNEPICPHFGECGGCALQCFSYSKQVEIKQEALRLILGGILGNVKLVPAKNIYEYRQRMDYVVTHNPIHKPHDRIGLRRKGNFNHVIDLNECHLIPTEWFPKLRDLFKFASNLGIPNYDLVPHTGDLRYFVIRQAESEALLSIVTKSTEYAEQIEDLAEKALELGFTSAYWQLQPSLSDVSYGNIQKYWGKQNLRVKVQVKDIDYQFDIGPNTFFQNNVAEFGRLLETLVDYIRVNNLESSTLLDLYSGVGTIGICLSNLFDKVIGIETNPDSVTLALHNVEVNGFSNLEYYSGDFDTFIEKTGLSNLEQAVAIVDPPRAGLEEKGVTELLKLAPRTIIYISCNPITQVQDIQRMYGYQIVHQMGFDMFPQTLHMENIIVLNKI